MHGARATLPALLVALVAVVPSSARAETSRKTPVHVDLLGAALGGIVHREPVGGFDAILGLSVSDFRLALAAPMRFGRGGLRRADWDEPADYGRIVAEVAWGEPGDRVFARLGTLSGVTLGPGTLVSRLASTLDPDHWRSGAQVALDFEYAGGEAFVDSFIAPAVAGGRVFARVPVSPRGHVVGWPEIGATFAADVSAPVAWRHDAGGDVRLGRGGLPEADTRRLLAGGGDLRWPVVRAKSVEVAPYGGVDRLGDGLGFHAGLAVTASPGARIRFGLEGAWHRARAGYVPSYFDTLYELDRLDAGGAPKQAGRVLTGTRDGLTVGFSFAWARYLSLWARLDLDRESIGCGLRSGLRVEAGPVRVDALFAERGFGSAAGLARPDRLLFASSVEVRIVPRLSAFASYARDATVAASGADRGRLVPSDTALAGLRVAGGW